MKRKGAQAASERSSASRVASSDRDSTINITSASEDTPILHSNGREEEKSAENYFRSAEERSSDPTSEQHSHDNPHEPSHPPSYVSNPPAPPLQRHRQGRKRAVRCRIQDYTAKGTAGLSLPPNQYERVLIRRAVRKDSANTDSSLPTNQNFSSNNHPVGDVSLGMKLTVIAGKVIVQTVTALADGRASPAQLAGFIQRGDVLLSINEQSLVNLSFDELMRGLGPLSSPNPDGLYQRKLKLRFLVADGVGLLERHDAANEAALQAAQQMDAASEMFGIFPMVDQLGGFHYGEDDPLSLTFQKPSKTTHLCSVSSSIVAQQEVIDNNMPSLSLDKQQHERGLARKKPRPALDGSIAKDVVDATRKERARFVNEVSDGDSQSDVTWPRCSDHFDNPDSHAYLNGTIKSATQSTSVPHVFERGKRALLGAKALSDRLESIETGKNDVRSFKSWTTTLSVYSRASARRKLVYDGASLPTNFGRLDEGDENDTDHDGDKDATSNFSNELGMDADEFLVQMAAHDEVWKKQVIDFFTAYIKELDEPAQDDQQSAIDEHKLADMDAALSNELGHFLFGEKMSRIMKRGRASLALPPEEVTLVMFDLTTKICATIPNQIGGTGSIMSNRSNATPFAVPNHPPVGSDSFLASRFLLDEALPNWLKSFHPLPWEERRLVWPLGKEPFSGSTAASTLSDDLSTDSMSASHKTQYLLTRKRKNLRERIEEKELNLETLTETCFLTTFYFLKRVLPSLRHDAKMKKNNKYVTTLEDNALSFINTYGSYLRLHTCLVGAISDGADRVVDALLSLAKHDPRHREVMKQLAKASTLVFYEPTMLSAVLQLLADIRSHSLKDRRMAIVDLCVAAFPDVRPGQVKRACCVNHSVGPILPDPSQLEFDDLYYIYLSQLLHPVDGQDAAKGDATLVEEWCRLSLYDTDNGFFTDRAFDRMANFLAVTRDRVAYKGNLRTLLELAMGVSLHSIALDLAAEAVRVARDAKNQELLDAVLAYARTIALNALETNSIQQEHLSKVLGIFQLASNSNLLISVPAEFCRWFDYLSFDRALGLCWFLAREAIPAEALGAIALWIESLDMETAMKVLPTLRLLLSRAASESLGRDLSGALLQLRRARQVKTKRHYYGGDVDSQNLTKGASLWRRMATGDVKFCK